MNRKRIVFRLIAFLLILLVGHFALWRLSSSSRSVQVFHQAVSVSERNDKSSLRIACFNIAHGRGQSNENYNGESQSKRLDRLKRIAELISSIDADIVVLNEVDFCCTWSHSINQAEFLAASTDYPYRVEQRNLDVRLLTWNWQFGNCILSRYPINHASLIDFPPYSIIESVLAGKKCGVRVSIDFEGVPIEIAGVHLSHRSEDLRARSISQLVQFGGPIVLAGDFNSTPTGFPESETGVAGTNAIDLLDDMDIFQRHPRSVPSDSSEFTYSTLSPSKVIDWILVSKDLHVEDYVICQTDLSDHRLIHAELRLLKRKKED